jgi:HlyD family secretion protein
MRVAIALLATGLAAVSCKNEPHRNVVSGTIETDEVHIASRYGGRVEKIFAQEGEMLKPGQAVAQLEAAELQARRDAAAAELAEFEAGPREQEIDASEHDWQALAADLAKARSDAKRADQLFQDKTISPTEHDQAVARESILEKQAAASKSRYELLKAGTRPERIAQAKANLAMLDAQLREMKISAPSASILEVLSVKVGDVLGPDREVATLLVPEQTWVRVYVPEPWLGRIRLGEEVTVQVDSDPNETFHGTVEQIANQAEFTPRNVQTVGERIKQVFGIKVRLKNESGKLRAGMAADVTFTGIGS